MSKDKLPQIQQLMREGHGLRETMRLMKCGKSLVYKATAIAAETKRCPGCGHKCRYEGAVCRECVVLAGKGCGNG